jgi:Transposase protein
MVLIIYWTFCAFPYDNSKIYCVRGLIFPWKQVIYFNFDVTMSKKLLFSIIKLCESSYANVRGIVCDMGNGKILKELKVYSEKKHYFENPSDNSRKVYIFPDVPHCIKNLRNHCLDSDLCVKREGDQNTLFLRKHHFDELISSDQADFKLCPKLSFLHVNCKGNDRQRVKYAVQLFSDTVSKALKFKFGETVQGQAQIISIICRCLV